MNSVSRVLTEKEVAAFGEELDALRANVTADLGERDARYIRRIVKAVRYSGAAGRGLLFLSFFPPCWVLGTLSLALSKILENMELGHNVIHGQYDWMGDPDLNGKTYEWDIVGTSEHWRKTHNYRHHTYTNIRGMDDDIGYDILRLFPEQRWYPRYLPQPLYALIFAVLFEWGVAVQDLRLGRYFRKGADMGRLRREFQPIGVKMRRQILKDYVLFPVLAGPFFLPVLAGNFLANVLRNLWTYMIIFCGHFTKDATTFPKSVLSDESRGQWYLRQIQGSSNLEGGKWFHILTGNLSHQIEHHLFPDIPAHRYAEMAVEVRAICRRYGQRYNTGPLRRQFGQVVYRIFRHALPSRPAKLEPVPC